MTINLKMPDITELKPRITVFGVGGAGGNAVNNMITSALEGVEFVVANTDSQALKMSRAERVVQMGIAVTEGLGAGSHPEIGAAAAEECMDEIKDHLQGSHMAFVTAGMGGGTGTGAAPVIARTAREMGILTVGVVTKPFLFEGPRRMRIAEAGIEELQANVDTLIVIPNQNLFRIANEKTTFSEAFARADEVLRSGVACITDLMVKEGLINLDFADVRAVMRGMGRAMMGTGEASGDTRAIQAAEAAIANPLLDETSMQGAKGLLISITGGNDLTLYEVDAAATRIRDEVDPDANIILGATFDEALEGMVRVSVVATGIKPEESQVEIAGRQPAAMTMATSARTEVRSPKPVAAPAAAVAHKPAAESAPRPAPRPAPRDFSELSRELREGFDDGATAAKPAPAPAPAATAPAPEPMRPVEHAGVTLERRAPQAATPAMPQPMPEPEPIMESVEYTDDAFLPDEADHPVSAPRMPSIEDFPAPAQAEYRAHHGERQNDAGERHRRPGFFERIASGLTRREDDGLDGYAQPEEPAPMPRMQAARPQQASDYAKPQQRPAHHEPQVAHAPRRQPAGQPMQQPRAESEDDQYEIPAFLRRQAN
ncbi:MAG: cell division protein FtsZ [Rhodobiaceae bacterium]|nr:cell division protein FtsZ [Rhodobiaceae bacterium]MCC0040864.1 cell division protein FtsZ [Rhodobiaceae bacterium]